MKIAITTTLPSISIWPHRAPELCVLAEAGCPVAPAILVRLRLLGLDRSGLAEVSPDGKQFVVTHSYQLPGIPPSSRLILHEQFPTLNRQERTQRSRTSQS